MASGEQLLPAYKMHCVVDMPACCVLARPAATRDVRLNQGHEFLHVHPRFQPENIQHNLTLLNEFETMAKEKSATPAQLALAWLIAQGPDIIPIPSNKSRKHLEENIKAAEIKLTSDDLARLDRVFPQGAAAGPRTKDMNRVNV